VWLREALLYLLCQVAAVLYHLAYLLYLSWELVSVLDWDDWVLDRDRSPTEMTQFRTQLTRFWTETIRTVSVLDQDNQTISVLDWDNIRTISVLDQDNQTISVLDWVVSVEDRHINSITTRTIIHNVSLAYHYSIKRSLNQNIFVKYSNKQRHIYLLTIEHNNSNKTIIHFARHFRITAC
jgi:hypothetical protein